MRDWHLCEEGSVTALFDLLVIRTPFESCFQCYDSIFFSFSLLIQRGSVSGGG